MTTIETTTSNVVLRGDIAYKTKKAHNFGYADFRALNQRKEACERELELNRRLAPDVYLSVRPVHEADGQVSDYAVEMRRLPSELSLEALVRSGRDVRDGLRSVARQMVAFHSRALTNATVGPPGSAESLRRRWHDLFDRLQATRLSPKDAELVAEIRVLADRYIDGRAALFASRVEKGLIKDGHGDLLASDVYLLPDGPRLLDCLDFDDQLRYVDVVDDVASLASDLEHLGASDLAAFFVAWYNEYSGASPTESLENHYIAYRATVRALVNALGAQQGVAHASSAVTPLLTQALGKLRLGAVKLILVGGAPGTGKSTLAQGIADECGYVLISSDRVRQEMTVADSNRYSEFEKQHVYDAMLERAKALLAAGESVVLDATWSWESRRRNAARIAEQTSSDLVAFQCQVNIDLAMSRVRNRLAAATDPSEADERVAIAIAQEFEPWIEAIAIDGEDIRGKGIEQALEQLCPSSN